MKFGILISIVLVISSCSGAPLSLRTFANGNVENGLLVAELRYLLREGKYCSSILIGDRNSDDRKNLDAYEGKVSLKYVVEIPSINYSNEVDLGAFDPNDYGFMFEGGYSFHQFTINVDNVPSYRAHVKTTLYVNGTSSFLESGEFGIHFSEWACK